MKKVLVLLLSLMLILTMSVSALAAPGASKGKGKVSEKTTASLTAKTSMQKQFKLELNDQKKEIAKQISALEEQLLAAQAASSTDEASATAITDLEAQIAALQAQKKQIINERYMVTKTLYSEEELQRFENAAALIKQMYADAGVLGAGSVTVKNNLIKFEAPPYIKGGKTLVPIRAITEGLGAEVLWDSETQSVTISKDDTVVVITINSTTVSVTKPVIDPVADPETDPVIDPLAEPVTETVMIDVLPEITCGRTYVPLRFLAETFGLDVNYDGEEQTIDIGEESTDTTSDTATTDTLTETTDPTTDAITDDTTATDTTTTDPAADTTDNTSDTGAETTTDSNPLETL